MKFIYECEEDEAINILSAIVDIKSNYLTNIVAVFYQNNSSPNVLHLCLKYFKNNFTDYSTVSKIIESVDDSIAKEIFETILEIDYDEAYDNFETLNEKTQLLLVPQLVMNRIKNDKPLFKLGSLFPVSVQKLYVSVLAEKLKNYDFKYL